MVTTADDLTDLIESGLCETYPEVFVECALFNLRKVCISDFEALKSAYLADKKSLDPYQHARCLLTKERPALMQAFNWLHSTQRNIRELQSATCHAFVDSPFKDFKIAIIGSLFTPDVYEVLKPHLYAYLLLEVLSAEEAVPSDWNCFKELKSTGELLQDASLNDLLAGCRELFSSSALFSFSFLLEDLISPFIESAFISKTRELIGGCYTKPFLASLKTYEKKVLRKSWLPGVLDCTTPLSPPWSSQLVCSTFFEVRRKELYAILLDYPQTHAAVMDLKAYLLETHCLQNLIDPLSLDVSSKLLQSGVHTDEILLGYGSLVRGLREIDPSSVAQDIVCSPVASYLREREDAVRCIVDRLIAPASEAEKEGVEPDQLTGLQKELLLPAPLEVEPSDETRDCDAHLVFHGRSIPNFLHLFTL